MIDRQELLAALAEEFCVPVEEVFETDALADYVHGSLDGISMLFGLEKKYGVHFDRDALLKCDTVQDLADEIDRLLSTKQEAS